MGDAFSACHPAVNLLYFALVLGCSMVLLHPACLLISLGAAIVYGAVLKGKAALGGSLRFLPLAAFAAGVNVAFNHQGAIILAYLPTGNPLTVESIAYGLATAGMLWAVITWFSCWNAVMTTDKLVYLFGRLLPALSLVVSMALRFVPRFLEKFREIREAQRCLGRDLAEGTLGERLKKAVTMLSILLTWSLENAVETADSMRARGYGLPGRTAFSLYRFDRRDALALAWLTLWGAGLLVQWKQFTWHYYPTVGGSASPTALGCYLALCFTPVILHTKEELVWKRSRSEM